MFRSNLIPTVLFLIVSASACSEPVRRARKPTPGRPALKVMTYNVNYGLRGDPIGLLAIREARADVVLLQETTAEWEVAIRSRLARTYPHMHFEECCGAGGLGVLSRFPIREIEYLKKIVSGGWFPAMRVVVETSVGAVQVLNVHLHPPLSDSGSVLSGYFSTPSIREAEIIAFAKSLDNQYPTLVVGDFNESSGGAVQYLAERGYGDALDEFHPDDPTWRWPTSVGEIDSTLDHVMYDQRLEPLDAKVLRQGRSDHFPVVATFELSKTATIADTQ